MDKRMAFCVGVLTVTMAMSVHTMEDDRDSIRWWKDCAAKTELYVCLSTTACVYMRNLPCPASTPWVYLLRCFPSSLVGGCVGKCMKVPCECGISSRVLRSVRTYVQDAETKLTKQMSQEELQRHQEWLHDVSRLAAEADGLWAPPGNKAELACQMHRLALLQERVDEQQSRFQELAQMR